MTGFGFWIFLLSDIVMFSCFFAAYAVLLGQTAGGPSGAELFDLQERCDRNRLPAAVELHLRACDDRCRRAQSALVPGRHGGDLPVGLGFLALEFREFADLVARGAGPSRSAFLSAFFTLVGCHGAHVSAGTLWLLTMMAQVFAKGFRADILRRLLCFALFWHVLDIIWVAIFSVVYLIGSARMSDRTSASSWRSRTGR